MRAAVLRFSAFADPIDAISILEKSTLDAHKIVRETVINLLEEIATQRVIKILQKIANTESNDSIRNEAMAAIRNTQSE